jgi:hypothetical protein
MEYRHMKIVIFIFSFTIMFGVLSTGHLAFSQESSSTPLITIQMDKSSYMIGDTLKLSGQLYISDEGKPVTIQLLDPKNHVYQTKANVSEDGSFTYSVVAIGAVWKPSGIYTVKVIGPNSITAETTFQFIGERIQTSPTLHNTPSPIPTPPALDPSAKMPNWVKSLFNLYNKGEISYNDINNALKFLTQTGIIRRS